jgi:hypothetical protein
VQGFGGEARRVKPLGKPRRRGGEWAQNGPWGDWLGGSGVD